MLLRPWFFLLMGACCVVKVGMCEACLTWLLRRSFEKSKRRLRQYQPTCFAHLCNDCFPCAQKKKKEDERLKQAKCSCLCSSAGLG